MLARVPRFLGDPREVRAIASALGSASRTRSATCLGESRVRSPLLNPRHSLLHQGLARPVDLPGHSQAGAPKVPVDNVRRRPNAVEGPRGRLVLRRERLANGWSGSEAAAPATAPCCPYSAIAIGPDASRLSSETGRGRPRPTTSRSGSRSPTTKPPRSHPRTGQTSSPIGRASWRLSAPLVWPLLSCLSPPPSCLSSLSLP